MSEYLTKQLLLFMESIGFVWTLLVLATALFLFKKRWGSAAMTGFVVLFLFLVGSTSLPGTILGSLEQPYAGMNPVDLPEADAIVMLGGGAEPALFEAGFIHLTTAGDRYFMALELLRLRKAPVLVLGGAGGEFPDRFLSESKLAGHWFANLRDSGALDRSLEIEPLPVCVNTHDEAVFTRELAQKHGWKRVLLVTSANHMRRASAVFEAQGLKVIPAPCNFLTSISTPPTVSGLGIPSWGGFQKISIWLHEILGWYVYKHRGWVHPEGRN